MGAKKQTIGYRYYFSLHMGIGRRVNEIAEIRVGDVTAHDTAIDISEEGRLVRINKPDLFGGDKKEGGIDGLLYCYNGAPDQELQPALTVSTGDVPLTLPAIAASLGGDVPNFRGVTTLWYDGMVCAMNPYPKEWSFRVRRHSAGWWGDTAWYPQMARIIIEGSAGQIHAMNPAHMLYEINTNPEWGRGMPPELIDENSYRQAANTLCSEGFGLCIPWFRQENLKDFIPVVINHIGAAQYVDRETGLMTLRLIRGDYDINDLPLFTPETGLIDILDDDNSGEETAYNEIIVTGFDPTTKEDIQVRVQNLAAIQSQGEIISNTIEYRGLSTKGLVGRVAQRELKVQLPLRRMSVVLDRRGWRIAPGMPFRVSCPSKGISNLVLRAGEARDGTLRDGKITVKAVQDIFGMPATAYVDPPESGWTPPSFVPAPAAESRMYEVNWRDFYRQTDTADQDAVDAGASFVAILAREPEGVQTQGFDVVTGTSSGNYDDNGINTVGFTNWLLLSADMAPLDTTLEFEDSHIAAFMQEFEPGMAVLVDDEQMEFVAFDEVTRLATLKRGVADTLPAAHVAGATIWLIDDEIGADGVQYEAGETVYGKALTRTSSARLDEADAPEVSITVDQRVFRPYPPGNLKIDGDSVYAVSGTYPEPVFTWAHRDRKMQADALVGHGESSVGPEPGTTYRFRLYGVDGITLLRTIDVGAVDTWTYTAALRAEDGGPNIVWFEVESLRDGAASYFHYRFRVIISGGWGSGWGDDWGDDYPDEPGGGEGEPMDLTLDPSTLTYARGYNISGSLGEPDSWPNYVLQYSDITVSDVGDITITFSPGPPMSVDSFNTTAPAGGEAEWGLARAAVRTAIKLPNRRAYRLQVGPESASGGLTEGGVIEGLLSELEDLGTNLDRGTGTAMMGAHSGDIIGGGSGYDHTPDDWLSAQSGSYVGPANSQNSDPAARRIDGLTIPGNPEKYLWVIVSGSLRNGVDAGSSFTVTLTDVTSEYEALFDLYFPE